MAVGTDDVVDSNPTSARYVLVCRALSALLAMRRYKAAWSAQS